MGRINKITGYLNEIILVLLVPLVSGCGGGGGPAALGSLFGPAVSSGTGGGDGIIAQTGSGSDLLPLINNGGSGESIALAHGPNQPLCF